MAGGPADHGYGVFVPLLFLVSVLMSIVSVICMDSCGVPLVSSVFRLTLSEVDIKRVFLLVFVLMCNDLIMMSFVCRDVILCS